MKPIVAKIRSHSDGRRIYRLTITKAGKLHCSCPAWSFGGGTGCKHIRQWQAETPNWQQAVANAS